MTSLAFILGVPSSRDSIRGRGCQSPVRGNCGVCGNDRRNCLGSFLHACSLCAHAETLEERPSTFGNLFIHLITREACRNGSVFPAFHVGHWSGARKCGFFAIGRVDRHSKTSATHRSFHSRGFWSGRSICRSAWLAKTQDQETSYTLTRSLAMFLQKFLQAVRAAEQGGEDRGVGEQDVTGAAYPPAASRGTS